MPKNIGYGRMVPSKAKMKKAGYGGKGSFGRMMKRKKKNKK